MEKVGDGLWSVNAANTRSLAVEFADHIVMLEGPTSEARSLAVNEAVRKTVPNKPIRYVVNTHAHYDHAGGLRTYVAEGITVITHEANKPFFEQAWARPRTIEPDAAGEVAEAGDDRDRGGQAGHDRRLAHPRAVSPGRQRPPHGPAHRLSAEGAHPDVRRRLQSAAPATIPGRPSAGPSSGCSCTTSVQQLKLNPARIAPVHGRVVPFENFKIAWGIGATNTTW